MSHVAVIGFFLTTVALTGTGIGAYSDATSDVRENTTRIEDNEKSNKERYNNIRKDTSDIRELLNKLLLQKQQQDN